LWPDRAPVFSPPGSEPLVSETAGAWVPLPAPVDQEPGLGAPYWTLASVSLRRSTWVSVLAVLAGAFHLRHVTERLDEFDFEEKRLTLRAFQIKVVVGRDGAKLSGAIPQDLATIGRTSA